MESFFKCDYNGFVETCWNLAASSNIFKEFANQAEEYSKKKIDPKRKPRDHVSEVLIKYACVRPWETELKTSSFGCSFYIHFNKYYSAYLRP